MPKTDTPATRRSARVASRAEVPKPEPKAVPKAVARPKPASKEKKAEDKPASAEKKEDKPASKKESKDKPASKEKPASKKDSAAAEKPASKPASKKEAPASKDKPTSKKAETASSAPLALGDKLPKITLQDNTGADVDVSTIAGEKGVVIFLYPKANTPGCTTQACGFRDIHTEIADLGYDVYGLSKDKPSAQQSWIDKKELNYKLLCDPDSKLIKKLGAFVPPGSTKRSHFIFEKGTGKLIDIALSVKPADDPTNSLEFIKKHHA